MKLVLAGAPLDTGNRGVEALGRAVLDACDSQAAIGEPTHVTLLDNGLGVRGLADTDYEAAVIDLVGARLSRRWYRPENWAQVRIDQLFGSRLNPIARRIRGADALLDISGGDSFTDLYGPRRLAWVCAPKEAALRAGTPLVLLPQTYGPFETRSARRRAETIVKRSSLAYSRDSLSHQRLLALAGPDADHARCRPAVDVAFALRPSEPVLAPGIRELLGDDRQVRAGLNVSGLLASTNSANRFGLRGDYLETMTELTRQLLGLEAIVVFVPHVHGRTAEQESDISAALAVSDRLTTSERARTVVLPALNASELKWCIESLNWMIGSRMHSTIASLSSQVPTIGYAYSDKTAGVFATCGVEDKVIDARRLAGFDAVEIMIAEFKRREEMQDQLNLTVPSVVSAARYHLQEALESIAAWRHLKQSPGTIGVGN